MLHVDAAATGCPGYADASEKIVSRNPLGSLTSNARLFHSVSLGSDLSVMPALLARFAISSTLPGALTDKRTPIPFFRSRPFFVKGDALLQIVDRQRRHDSADLHCLLRCRHDSLLVSHCFRARPPACRTIRVVVAAAIESTGRASVLRPGSLGSETRAPSRSDQSSS